MTRYVWNGEHWAETAAISAKRSVGIISDHMDPLLHPVTGEILDSKSQFRARTRASGCIELGNDAPIADNRPKMDRKEVRNDIYRAISELEQGRPAPLAIREGDSSRRYG